MSQFWSPLVHQLTPYVPGEQPRGQSFIKLNTNENPYPPSPKVLAALSAALDERLRLYPDPQSSELCQGIADYHGLDASQVFVGNGSDEVLAHLFQALLKQDRPLQFPDITYSFYPVYCGLYGIDYQQLPLTANYQVDLSQYDPLAPMIVPNPNAPTGVALPLAAIEQRLQESPHALLVVDEAYVDFGAQSADQLIAKYDNLLVTRTYSKSMSLAGMRLGYALGQAHLIQALERVKDSFNSYPVDRLAAVAGLAAINDAPYLHGCCQRVIENREQLVSQLAQLGFHCLPSAANFVLAEHQSLAASELYAQLKAKGILVRYFNKPRLDNHLRISIGTQEECQQLVAALRDLTTS